jgi:hypothetical protein
MSMVLYQLTIGIALVRHCCLVDEFNPLSMAQERQLVYEGEMYKRVSGWNIVLGGKWRKRQWQLFDDGLLIFYKKHTSRKGVRKEIRGRAQISCKSYAFHCHFMKDIIEDYPRAVENDCCFSIITEQRNFHLYTSSRQHRQEWTKKIGKVINTLKSRGKQRSCEDPEEQH